MKLTFWGTRGSVAVPGRDTLRYGGNTTCLSAKIEGAPPVVIDAGTGIRPLGRVLASREGLDEILLMVTHLHWDHLLGFLFFDPAFMRGLKINVTGWPKAVAGLKSIFDSKRRDGHFPITFDSLPADIQTCPQRKAPGFQLGGAKVTTTPLNHPQGAVGFRFQEGSQALVFITDNEIYGPGPLQPDGFARFADGAKVLIHDAQYLPEEMNQRKGFGHSDWRQSLELAEKAGVERLILTHHDPARTDDQVDELVSRAQSEAKSVQVEAAREGQTVTI